MGKTGKTIVELPQSKENVFIHNLAFLPISAQESRLLTLIAYRNQMGNCIHSNSRMGEIVGCDRSRIAPQLKRLQNEGYIEIINPGNPKKRAIAITPKTEEILQMNTQKLIEAAQKQASSRFGESQNNPEPKSNRLENKPLNRLENKPKKPIQQARKQATEEKLVFNKNNEEVKDPNSSVEQSSPYKSGLENTNTALIENDFLNDLINNQENYLHLKPENLSNREFENKIIKFIIRNHSVEFANKSELESAISNDLEIPF